MINVVLCGGNGTRLWPLSQDHQPKQFSKILGNESFLQATIKRNEGLCKQFFFVSHEKHQKLLSQQVLDLRLNKECEFLLEPVSKNTAAAIALACFCIKNRDDVILVTPSDHIVKQKKKYEQAVVKAKKMALEDQIVTFGIKPTYPATGYGYIKEDTKQQYQVVSFEEKPKLAAASSYIEQRNYYWNSGIFCFKVNVFLNELKRHAPDIYHAVQSAYQFVEKHGSSYKIPFNKMNAVPEKSVDYAVLEKTIYSSVIPVDMGWSDVGTFDSLSQELPESELDHKVVSIDSSGNTVFKSNKKIVATIDVHGLIIVETKDTLLILKKGSSEKVKQIVAKLKNKA